MADKQLNKLNSSALLVALLCALAPHPQAAYAEPELHATAQHLPGLGHSAHSNSRGSSAGHYSLGADQSKFSLGTGQAKFNLGTGQSTFNLGTSAEQARAHNAVGIKVNRDNPAIMTIVGGNEADIQKLLAQRYHRVVVPCGQYTPAQQQINQQYIGQQQLNAQVIQQQVVNQQAIVSQPQPPSNNNQICAFPMETVNRFMNIICPKATPPADELNAEAKRLKPFGQATHIKWDPWYDRVRTAANVRWQSYNNQVATEATAHVTVYANRSLAVSAVDINIWKSGNPFDNQFNEATKTAVLQTLNEMKGSSILAFPAHTRRAEVSFDLIFSTAGKSGGRGGVGVNAPINDIETIYGL
jgi:hypothetical protein